MALRRSPTDAATGVLPPRNERHADRPVTVRDVLELPRLEEAGARVVAGGAALHREVKWVHAGEGSDISKFLRDGELLLTAGGGFGASAAERDRYITALSEVGASALFLELGKHMRSIPEEMLASADRVGLPVATLDTEVSFSDVTREVHAWLIGRDYALERRVGRISIEFNELLLSGGSTQQIVTKLFEVTGEAAFLEDAAHQLIEHAGPAEVVDDLVDAWSDHSRFGHRGPPRQSARDGERRCAWAPVVLRDEEWGRLHLVPAEGEVDEVDFLAVERASVALGLALLNNRHDDRLAERTRADLLAEAARRAPEDHATFLRQARGLGADFRGCELFALALAKGEGIDGVGPPIASLAASSGVQLLSSSEGEEYRALLGVRAGADTEARAREFAERILPAVPSGDIVLGVSRQASLTTIPRAFHEAAECLRFARVSNATGVLHFSSLGLHLLLATLLDGPELPRFVEAELGPLLDYDASASAPLLPTLRVLLTHDDNRSEAARALFLERRSLYYRIERIERILGKSLSEPDVKLGLGVALRALSLIEDRAKGSVRRR